MRQLDYPKITNKYFANQSVGVVVGVVDTKVGPTPQ